MKKNAGTTWRRTRSLDIVRLPRLIVLAMGLAVAAGIPLAIPGPASAQQPLSDLVAIDSAVDNVMLPPAATSAQAGTVQSGQTAWPFTFRNNSQTSVTNPTVSVQGGYDPSQYNFTWPDQPGQPVTAFPVTATQASLNPGQELDPRLFSNIPVKYTLGYNSTRTVGPSKIPVGGADQKVSITVTFMDSRYASTPPNILGGIVLDVGSNLSGVSLVSTTNPKNLNHGEGLSTSATTPFGLFEWNLVNVQLYKTYRFSATLHVPNNSGSPFVYRPFVQMSGIRTTFLCQACSGSSVTVADATLDGNKPGSGSATFSVLETGHTWTSSHLDQYNVVYQGT
jgi:hypothetical protein